MAKVTHDCAERVSDGWRSFPCRNNGKVEVDGKWYCGIHDPAKKAARRAAERVRYDAKSAVSSVQYRLSELHKEAAAWAFQHPDGHELRAKQEALRQQLAEAQAKLAALEKR